MHMSLSILHVIGILTTLIAVSLLGFYSGKKVSNASDFATSGGKAGAMMVAGTIMGTLVGGTSTVGTAQLAFSFGLSAWWFTLGAGIGCLVMTIAYVLPLRGSGCTTLLQIISREYGKSAGFMASVLCSIGIFINIIAQLLSGIALVTAVTPLTNLAAVLVVAALMVFYVIFGGVWGTGIVGVFKLILIYLAVIVGGAIAYRLSGGIFALRATLISALAGTELGAMNGIATAADVVGTFANLTARGFSKDVGSGVSLILGVLSTQTYAQAIWSARSDAAARKGALISSFLVPPIGIGGILVGLFMRTHYITASELKALGGVLPEGFMGVIEKTSQAFPSFLVNHMPGPVGALSCGVILATLLIAVVGTGAGLALGCSTIISNDILKKRVARMDDPKFNLLATRSLIAVILLFASMIAYVVPAAIINDFSYLSMGLRAAVVFVPMCCGLWLKGRIRPGFANVCIIAGPIAVIAGQMAGSDMNPLFFGIGACVVVMAMGLIPKRNPVGE